MRPSCVIFLLILALILTNTRGIRLEKRSLAVDGQQKQHEEENTSLLKKSAADQEAIICKDEQLCTGSIRNRKLVTTSVSSTKSLSKNVKKGEDVAQPNDKGEAKEVKVKSLITTTSNYYPREDPVEITEMDYSAARRKPPIHN